MPDLPHNQPNKPSKQRYNKQGSDPHAAQQNRSSTSGYCVKGTFNISKTYTVSSWILKRPLKFDRVWHAALGETLRAYKINIIQHLYDRASCAVYLNSRIGDWLKKTVGVRQGCLLSPTLFNIFSERMMTDALEDHTQTVKTGGRTLSTLGFAVDIDRLAGDEQELAKLVQRLSTTSAAYSMEVGAEKTKLMTNNADGINTYIRARGKMLRGSKALNTLDQLSQVKDLRPEIFSRIAQTRAAMTKLRPL